ncbi:MAG: hypothetical protein BMS9Abin36_1063 [Gammaproteobacteria bacterium]|nr:MAG: hypothetical protein BMS9Abin36_1063 [Gammaproteobacteria bacterium]
MVRTKQEQNPSYPEISSRHAIEYTHIMNPIRVIIVLAGFAALALLAGCQSLPAPNWRHQNEITCSDFFVELDARIAKAGVTDAAHARIPGYPFLRSSRFLASYKPQSAQQAWVDALLALGMQDYQLEIQNLDMKQVARTDLLKQTRRCATILRSALDGKQTGTLQRNIAVADDYIAWQRAVGLYPLLVPPMAHGIHNWQKEMRALFHERPRPSVDNKYYRPPSQQRLTPGELSRIMQNAGDNPLGLPRVSGSALDKLYQHYAPHWVIETQDNDDRPGLVQWSQDGEIEINPGRPVVYRYSGYTRLGKQALLQLNYVIWFPSRPRTSALDMLGGKLDGLVWRVTLATDGRALLYDSMHNCGCYHLFFPTTLLIPKPDKSTLAEQAFRPRQQALPADSSTMAIHLTSGAHYIRAILPSAPAPAAAVPYQWEDYDSLRSLPVDNGRHKSIFNRHGLITDTARRERYIFWPFGIRSPGAMRIKNRHATAFIGRRHFDDADLLERYFLIPESRELTN